jgi:hypothetical protein
MTSEDVVPVLRHQRSRGPLPSSPEGLSSFVAALQKRVPLVPVKLRPAEGAVSRLRAIGLAVEETDGDAVLQFPADGDALDRVLSLLGLPGIDGGAAALLMNAMGPRAANDAEDPPPLSLPLRIQPAKACSLGWSPELFSLTVLISNVSLRQHDAALLPKGAGPIVAVCAEYDRPLTSLDPPIVASYRLGKARVEGVPTLRLPSGWLRGPLRLERTARLARAPAGRVDALARAEKFLDELDDAWQQRIACALQVAWPVYRPQQAGPLLDAVVGRPLPEMELR